jgi:hypothetical protein
MSPKVVSAASAAVLLSLICIDSASARGRATLTGPLVEVFHCPSGFSTSSSSPCYTIFQGSEASATFMILGSFNGTTPTLTGPRIDLVPAGGTHAANNIDYRPAAVNVQQFSTTFTFVPNGQNVSFILSNNTNSAAAGTRNAFTAGASCEGSFFQGYTSSNPPNNTFAVMLDQYGGNAAGSSTFTYSSVQYYVTGQAPPNAPNAPGQNPCNPNPGGTLRVPYVGVNKISTSPVPLNNPVNTDNTTTRHTYSVTITYDGSKLTIDLYDVTAGGSCPGPNCFTHTWTGVNVPSIVGGNTAWVGIGASTGESSPNPLLINSWSYGTVLSTR